MNTIDQELLTAISHSAYSEIDYENLLQHNPQKIRDLEMQVSLLEPDAIIPHELDVRNRYIPSSDKGRNIRLRTYRSKDKSNLPVLVYFHGGAFIYGTPEQYDFIFFRLASDVDLMIVSVDYRLAPEHPFPAAMEDGYDSLKWLAQYASNLGGDPNRILIGGSSAGATIAASITHLARDKKEIRIRHQLLLYPAMSHLLNTPSMQSLADAPMQTKNAAKWMWKHYLPHHMDQRPAYAVPLLEENFNQLPEATLVVCACDPLKDEGKMYAEKLQRAGVSTELIEIQGAVHAFDFFESALSEAFYDRLLNVLKKTVNQDK